MQQPNLFNAGSIADGIKSTTGKSIPVGIHTEIELVEVVSDDISFSVTLKDKEGRTKTDKIFYPDRSKYGNMSDEDWKRLLNQRAERMVQYAEVFYNISELANISGNDIKDLGDKLAKAINSRKGQAKLNLKLIQDSTFRFSDFPRFAYYVERHIPGQEPSSKIAYTKWELDNRVGKTPIKPDSSDAVLPPKETDDMPF